MAQDRFMIAPIQGGLNTSIKPWLVPDDAFARLQNAYIYRGRVRKRFGSRLLNQGVAQTVSQLYSRLRIKIGTTNGSGNFSGNVPGIIYEVGQLFSIGTEIFTVYQTGTPAVMLDTGAATVKTFDTTTGAVVINGAAAATDVYWYPAEPVMGLVQYQTASSLNDPTYAFDTQFAFQYNPGGSGGWDILGPIPGNPGSALWSGTNSQFFWATTWQGATPDIRYLFVTNNNAADFIKYWDGTNWAVLNPRINANVNDKLTTSLILVSFKNRLIALNTTENIGGINKVFTNRARYAAFGDPTAATAWRSDIPGQGNAIDAATMEDIVSCEFIKDRLIVFFERSTWELAFTGNQAQPFTWQQLNTELGAESPFSVVPFDKVALAVGNTGIHACNGVNVERIDDKIPLAVWDVHTGTDEVNRVYGIRDYYAEQVYWTWPTRDTDPHNGVFPNQILVYNYLTGSWAFNDDSITVFGYYFEDAVSAITWDSTEVTWDSTEITWDSGIGSALTQNIMAGNQEGYTFIVDSNITRNSFSLQITNITVVAGVVTLSVINHNLNVQDFVYIQNLNGLTGNFPLIYQVDSVGTADSFTIIAPDILAALGAGQTYTGGGVIARVSRIDIFTKQYNFYVQEDRNAMVQKVNFLVNRTDTGEVTVDYATSSVDPEAAGLVESLTGTILGTSVLETAPYLAIPPAVDPPYPLEQLEDRLWHPVYLWADGESIQLRIYLSDTEMLNYDIATSNFEMHAMTFYTRRTASRLE